MSASEVQVRQVGRFGSRELNEFSLNVFSLQVCHLRRVRGKSRWDVRSDRSEEI